MTSDAPQGPPPSGGSGVTRPPPEVVQIVRVAPPDPRDVERDRTVGDIEAIVGRLDLHQRILVTRAVDAFADRVASADSDPWC